MVTKNGVSETDITEEKEVDVFTNENTEYTFSDGKNVSKAEGDQENPEGDQTAVEEEKPKTKIDLNDPEIKAYIEEQVSKKAQSLNDKKYAAKMAEYEKKVREREEELENAKKLQETENKKIQDAANFKAYLEAARRRLESEGVPDNVIEETMSRERKIYERSQILESEAQRFYKDRDEVQTKSLKFDLLEGIAEEYPDLPYGQALKLADEIMNTAQDKSKFGLRYALLKHQSKQATKPAPKTREPAKVDSGHSEGSGLSFTRAQIANMSVTEYAKNRDKIQAAVLKGLVK